jgi:hypothetical protein
VEYPIYNIREDGGGRTAEAWAETQEKGGRQYYRWEKAEKQVEAKLRQSGTESKRG